MTLAPNHERDWLLVGSGGQRLLLFAQQVFENGQQHSTELLRIVSGERVKFARIMHVLPRKMTDLALGLGRFGQSGISRIACFVARSGRAFRAHPAAVLVVCAVLLPMAYVA